MSSPPSQLRSLRDAIRAGERRAGGARDVRSRRLYNDALRGGGRRPLLVGLPAIHPRLWLSGLEAAEDALERGSAARTVCVASDRTCGYCAGRACEAVEAHDTEDATEAEVRAFAARGADAIERALGGAAGPVVVHCRQGRNRSVAAVVAFATRRPEWTAERAAAYVRARSERVRPGVRVLSNRLFRRALGLTSPARPLPPPAGS